MTYIGLLIVFIISAILTGSTRTGSYSSNYDMVASLAIILMFIKFIYDLGTNYFYSRAISKKFDYYKETVENYGLILSIIDGPNNEACEAKFIFKINDESKKIIFKYYGRKAMRLLKIIERQLPIDKQIRYESKKQRRYDAIRLFLKKSFELMTLGRT